MSKHGFALLGLDHWYAAFAVADAIERSERAQLVAVADDDTSRAEQVARERGVAAMDHGAILARSDVEVVVAMHSSDRNVELVRAAAAAGKHIIGVKPMALDLAGADAIVAAVQAAGVHYLPFECSYRLAPVWRQVKAWIDEGRIGQALRYTHSLHGGLPQAWPKSSQHGWWLDRARVPGGAWIDHAIYAVDLARWLFASEIREVRGVAANLRHANLPVEDYGTATFTMQSGALALIEDSWTAEPGFWFNRSEVVGSAGVILDETGMGGELRVRGASADWTTARLTTSQNGLVEHMVACLRGEQAPLASVADGRANLAACLSFYQAAQTGHAARGTPVEL